MMQRAWSAGLLMALVGCTLDGLPYPVRSPGAVTDGGTDTGVAICALGQTNCGTGCVNTSADPANCGGCGRVCGSGMACAGGACVAICPTGTALCGGTCVNTGTDTANCGVCGRVCAAGTTCSGGACSSICAAGQTYCGGSCVSTATDVNNCGACGRVCPGPTVGTGALTCTAGACGIACIGATSTLCGAGCYATGTDPANCGSCGHACAAGQTCSGGTCSTGACPSGMAMIPGGTFMMGAADLGATPVHTVTLTSYCMDVTEVTVAAYATCPSGTCTAPVTGDPCNWMVAGRDNHPINCVTWDQSRAYCQWVHGGGGDLPTEAQWEYAAAGGAMDWEYPWGNDAPADQLCWSGGSAGSRSSTCPVMSFPTPADAFGLFDMAGNVWEWTGDCYGAYSSAAAVNPTGPTGSCTDRVSRGGCWYGADPTVVRAAVRSISGPSSLFSGVGFRCARPL